MNRDGSQNPRPFFDLVMWFGAVFVLLPVMFFDRSPLVPSEPWDVGPWNLVTAVIVALAIFGLVCLVRMILC